MLPPRGVLVLAVVCAGQGLWVLDLSLITVALPSIQRDLAPDGGVQWIPAAFAIAFGGALPVAGRAADLYDRRTLFTLAALLFAASSLLAGLAPSLAVLLLARIAAGLAAAVLVPCGLALIASLYPDARARAWALSVCGAVLATAFAVGALLGGILTTVIDWRGAILATLVPPAPTIAALTAHFLPPGFPPKRTDSLSPFPMLLLILTIGGALLTLQWLSTYGLTMTSTVIAGLSLACLLAFVRAHTRSPVLPTAIITNRSILAPNVSGLLLVAAGDTVLFLTTLHLQTRLHYSPTQAGAFFALFGIAAFAGGSLAAPLMRRMGARYTLVSALSGQALSFVPLVVTDNHTTYLWPAIAAFGLTNMAAIVAISELTMAAAPIPDRGSAAAFLQTTQQFGAALGVTTAGLLTNNGRQHLATTFLIAIAITLCGAGMTVFCKRAATREPHRKFTALTRR